MFKQRIETVGSIKEFMNRGRETVGLHESELEAYEKAKPAGLAFGLSTLPLAIAPFTKLQTASAHGTESVTVVANNADMYDKMVTAFDPLIVLVQSLAYPIATVVVLGGAIMVMIGQKEKGYSLMMSAGLGYVLVNMTPMILNILVDAMKAV
ncbi:hypothetical protein [Bacillus sp. AFS040349]|uniref:hypothetical protein n=1 Tax=Bacillus sp. AFS040349 TaxID=2033502 RepID=UPI000BFEA027|nr:hypothetical protein [Bacillus sp. AFS040349]PGT89238.1 hypothetical protein COD11_04360 [Bacillus sp. AFS040349]